MFTGYFYKWENCLSLHIKTQQSSVKALLLLYKNTTHESNCQFCLRIDALVLGNTFCVLKVYCGLRGVSISKFLLCGRVAANKTSHFFGRCSVASTPNIFSDNKTLRPCCHDQSRAKFFLWPQSENFKIETPWSQDNTFK